MNPEQDISLDGGKDRWLDDLLEQDAGRDDLPANSAFSAALMASLPSQRSFDVAQVARLTLSGIASGIAAIIVIADGPHLLNQFIAALMALQPATMIETATPFAMLLGLGWFTYQQLQTD